MDVSWKFFWRALRDHKSWYLIGALSLIVTSLTEVLAPKFIQWIVDLLVEPTGASAQHLLHYFGGTPRHVLYQLVGIFCLVLFVAFMGRVVWRQTLARRTHVATRELKVSLWEQLQKMDLEVFRRLTLGDIMSRVAGDVQASRNVFGFTLVLILDAAFFVIFATVAMVQISPWLTVWSLLVFVVAIPLIRMAARREYRLHLVAQEDLARFSETITQALIGLRLIRATGSHSEWEHLLNREALTYARSRRAVLQTGLTLFPLGAVPMLIASVVALCCGIPLVQSQALSIGQLVAFQTYLVLMQTPLFEIGDVIAEWQRGFASLRRIGEFWQPQVLATAGSVATAAAPAETLISSKQHTPPALLIDDLIIPPSRQPLRLAVEKGSWLGIHGPCGKGKSRLLEAVAAVLPCDDRRVFIAGHSLRELRGKDQTRLVTLVEQRPFVFAGSVRANLTLGSKVADEKLWQALEIVQLDSEVKSFAKQLDEEVGEGGGSLSGGQRQRLAIARALLRDSALYLFDDVGAALDRVTEEALLQSLKNFLVGKTVVWVSSRLESLRVCDRVLDYESLMGQH